MNNLNSESHIEEMGIYSVGRLGEPRNEARDDKPFSMSGRRSHRNDIGAAREPAKRGFGD